jgi:hypothetical protein
MATSRNEKTSEAVAKLAGRVLKSGQATPEEIRTLAASVLTQAVDRPKPDGAK